MEVPTLIKVEHLTKQYAAIKAVDDISFAVRKNEVLGFLGPNGAGKSTTLKILTGYSMFTRGKVTIGGFDVACEPEKVKSIIGYLPENVPLYPELRIGEYLKYRAGLKGVKRTEKKKTVDYVLEQCRLTDASHRIIGQLSKGYRQRVGIADTLLGNPEILIFDEPTIGLDPNQIRDIRELIKSLKKERTVILSSHILPEVEAVCSRIIIINKGKIAGEGEPEELKKQLSGSGSVLDMLVMDINSNAQDSLLQIEGIKKVESGKNPAPHLTPLKIILNGKKDVREEIFDTAVKQGFKIIKMDYAKHSLEDIFVHITTEENKKIADRSDNRNDVD
jgi:ABC-2 type transport system ATP-binding protein